MSARAQTVRLSPAQHRTLAGFARQRGLSAYVMLARVVDTGLATLIQGTGGAIDAREAGRIKGERAEVITVDEQARTAIIQTGRGATETLHLDSERDRHIAHGYVDTAFAAQWRTADHVTIHADNKAANPVDRKSLYVGISRARESAIIFTNDRGQLIAAINERAGQVQTAIAQVAASGLVAGNTKGSGLG